MTRTQVSTSSFVGGEIDPQLYGRTDLRAYNDGAARLTNVVVHATGGVSRRAGSIHITSVGTAKKIVPFESIDSQKLVLIGEDEISILDSSFIEIASFPGIWSDGQISDLSWCQINGLIVFCNSGVPPHILRQDLAGGWELSAISFDLKVDSEQSTQPFAKLVDDRVELQPTNINAANPLEDDPIPAGTDIEILASEPLFKNEHFGCLFLIKGREVRIQTVLSGVKARAIALEELTDGKTTRDFQEQVYSAASGWPAAVAWHQDRLVLGGSKAAPEQIWFSRTGQYFNFDLGTGLDDEAIGFRLSHTRQHIVRQLTGGRLLQVMTQIGEWVVSGNPLTPTNLQVDLQTNVGSPLDRQVRPVEVDGATIFAGASGRDIREFLYADSEQAYQAPDIALLSSHLIQDPIDMAFSAKDRRLAIAMTDGSLAVATLDRNANIIAWASHDYGAAIHAIAYANGAWHQLVERNGHSILEKIADQVAGDCAVVSSDPIAKSQWPGFEHLVGRDVHVIADGTHLGKLPVTGETLDIGVIANEIVAGLPYTHEIEPLTVAGVGRIPPLDILFRPIRSVFRVLDTAELSVQTEQRERTIFSSIGAPELKSGDFSLRDFGWRRGAGKWVWRIAQSRPFPFTLLSATTEIKVNN